MTSPPEPYWIEISIFPMIVLFMPLKYHVFENLMENGAFALLEQMLLFTIIFSKVSKTNIKIFLNFFQNCLKIENDIMS